MHRVAPVCILLIAWLLAGCAAGEGGELPVPESFIRADAIREELDLLSAQRGDGGAVPGRAARLLADRLRDAGLVPVAGTEYLQSVPIVGIRADPDMTMIVRRPRSSRRATLRFDEDFVAWSGPLEERARLDGVPLVFAGHGTEEPGSDMDAYRGKALLILAGDPHDHASGMPTAEDREDRLERGARRGAAAVFLIHIRERDEARWPEGIGRGERVQRSDSPRRPVSSVEGILSWEAAARLLRLAGEDLRSLSEQAGRPGFQPLPLDQRAEIEVRSTVRALQSASVLASVTGSDPTLAEEIVLFTGMVEAGDADTATLLAVARAFALAEPRPRRSIFFAFGNAGYGDEPAGVPADRTVARVSVEGVEAMAPGAPLLCRGSGGSSLERIVQAVAQRLDLEVISTPPEEAPTLPQALLSPVPLPDRDARGTPADMEEAARIGLLAYGIGLRVANEARPPRWDVRAAAPDQASAPERLQGP